MSTGKWGETIGLEKGRSDKERKGHTRNQANVSRRRMSMILLRLSIDSLLRASDRGTGQIHQRCCMITETHLVKSYAKKHNGNDIACVLGGPDIWATM